MIIEVHTEISSLRLQRLEYVIEFINHHPLVNSELTLKIINGGNGGYRLISGSRLEIEMQANKYLFSKKEYEDLPPPCLNSSRYKREEFTWISPEEGNHSKEITNTHIPFDIFESIFFHISRIEETVLPQNAYIGRKEKFEDQLLIIKSGKEKLPVVDDLVRLLVEVYTGKKIERKTRLAITHDIDVIQKFKSPLSIFRKLGGHFLHRKSGKGLVHFFKGYIEYLTEGKDPFDSFEWMLVTNPDVEKQIYFLSGGTHSMDTPYDQVNDRFRNIIKDAIFKGYEIGIHPSFKSWNDLDLIQKEKSHLEENSGVEIKSSRQHFLNFDICTTPELLLKAGIQKDSSLGFTRYTGFRCGTGFPYNLYDFENEKRSDLIEDPLVFMDSSCLHESGFNSKRFISRMESFFELNKYNSRINCNFHNSFFEEAALRNIPLKEIYLKLLPNISHQKGK